MILANSVQLQACFNDINGLKAAGFHHATHRPCRIIATYIMSLDTTRVPVMLQLHSSAAEAARKWRQPNCCIQYYCLQKSNKGVASTGPPSKEITDCGVQSRNHTVTFAQPCWAKHDTVFVSQPRPCKWACLYTAGRCARLSQYRPRHMPACLSSGANNKL